MVPRPTNGLSLCAGGGGLDMGIGIAEPGFHTRCYVEWEEYPRKAIIAAQQAGYFAPAPIWDDVRSFDAKPISGAIDTLLAGYPCQGESLAGNRKGQQDERWLWEDIERIINELGPTLQWCIFENVRGHVSLGLETVLRRLHGLDFANSVGIFSAEEVGAPHERQRVFIVAYRARPDGEWNRRQSARFGRSANDSRSMAHASQLFPPRPNDMDRWQTILEGPNSDLAPVVGIDQIVARALRSETLVQEPSNAALEPIVRRMADGLAARTRALRLLGNGVLPLEAAYAWRSLSPALGLRPVEMATATNTTEQ